MPQTTFLKIIDMNSYILKITVPNAAILLLGIDPKELKAGTQTGICTLIFIAALFTIAKSWK